MVAEKNFIDPQTGEEYYVHRYQTRVMNGELRYFGSDGFELEVDGVRLVKLGSITKTAVFTDEKKRV